MSTFANKHGGRRIFALLFDLGDTLMAEESEVKDAEETTLQAGLLPGAAEALRRFKEQSRRENPQHLEEILSDIYRRDLIDSTRMIAPLHPAADAIILNTDGMDVAQVVEKVITLVHVMAAEDPV